MVIRSNWCFSNGDVVVNNNQKLIAFTYSLLKFVEWSVNRDILNKKCCTHHFAMDLFNKENNFNLEKLKLLPYTLCASGASRKKMFMMFNSFNIDETGYVEKDIAEFISNAASNESEMESKQTNPFFQFFSIKEDRLQVNNDAVAKVINRHHGYKDFEPNYRVDLNPKKFESYLKKNINGIDLFGNANENLDADLDELKNTHYSTHINRAFRHLKSYHYCTSILDHNSNVLSLKSQNHRYYQHFFNNQQECCTDDFGNLKIDITLLARELQSPFANNNFKRRKFNHSLKI